MVITVYKDAAFDYHRSKMVITIFVDGLPRRLSYSAACGVGAHLPWRASAERRDSMLLDAQPSLGRAAGGRPAHMSVVP